MPLYLIAIQKVKNCHDVIQILSVPEGEDTGRSRDSCAGWLGEVLHRAGGGLGVGAVAPVVHDDRAVGVQLGGAPRGGGVLVCALVILHPVIGEGEHAGGALQGAAGVGNPLGEAEAALAGELEGVSGGQGQHGGEDNHGIHVEFYSLMILF